MQLRKFSLRKFWWLLAILISQSVVAYTPASISGKYTIDTIDPGDFCYLYWMNTTMASNYGSTDIVRESFAPSAVVDTNGDLYAISLWQFSDNNGPRFAIHKYVDGKYSKRITNFYPWTKIPGVTPNCTSTPSFGATGVTNDEDLFKTYIHNAFMPCLAQEVNGGSNYIYGFVHIPPTRFMNAKGTHPGMEYGSTEGILFFKLRKEGLSDLATNYIPHTAKASMGMQDRKVFQYSYLRPRQWGTYQPQWGNFTAGYNSSNKKVYLWHAADNGAGLEHFEIYRSTFSESGTFENLVEMGNDNWNAFLIPKIVRAGNDIYILLPFDGVTIRLYKQSMTNENDFARIATMNGFQFLEYATYNDSGETVSVDRTVAWTWSCFPFDFLILDAGNNKKVLCSLGFQGVNECHKNPPLSRFDDLKVFYLTEAQGWRGTETGDTSIDDNGFAKIYCNFNCKNASLILWSATLNDSSVVHYREHTSNIIYTTDIISSGATQATNTTADNKKRLYLNTHKVCVYKNYIIYAYCYPGKSNHLYIGYAPYLLQAGDGTNTDTTDSELTSDVRLRLLTKTEFKDANDNSFITDCSRIVSLDCKNGHVWLTYMSSNNTSYKYFYIKASDLVGE